MGSGSVRSSQSPWFHLPQALFCLLIASSSLLRLILALFDCLRCWFAAFPLCVSMVMCDSVETGSELFFQFGSGTRVTVQRTQSSLEGESSSFLEGGTNREVWTRTCTVSIRQSYAGLGPSRDWSGGSRPECRCQVRTTHVRLHPGT